MKGSRNIWREHFEQRGEVAVGLVQVEDAGAAIAVERLDDDVAEFLAEGVDLAADPW